VGEIDHFGRIDVLVNNAGYGLITAFEEMSPEQIHQQFATNVYGVMNVTRAVLPVMRRQRSGHLFTIASMGGYLAAERKPPLHLPVGADAVQLVEQHHNSVLNDIKAWRAKSSNTAFNAG
jgi:NAD(P)-dependent dehydrogenase (short-subunit alcohol dehydrogenase family)